MRMFIENIVETMDQSSNGSLPNVETGTLEKAEETPCLTVRLTSSQRSRYERAAALRGQTLTQWASFHLDACASHDIAEASATVLSDKAFERFCSILDATMPQATKDLLAREPIWH